MSPNDKPLIWLHGEAKSPPLSPRARLEAGYLLRRLQRGEALAMPHLRAMPAVGARCHELRLVDGDATWRVMLRIDHDAIVIVEVFSKKSRTTPHRIVEECRKRLRSYDNA